MAIDFSYLEGVAPQEESTPVMPDTANVTIRVDADSLLLCDGEYIDQPFKAGILTKIQLSPGQHLLEFLYTEDPDIKIEKEVDFPEAGKSYLVLIKGLKELVEAVEEVKQKAAEEETRAKAEEEEEAKRKVEEEAKRIAVLREPYVALSKNNQTLTFYYDHLKSNRNGVELEGRWHSFKMSNVITVVFDESFANFHDIYSTSKWFYSFRKLTSVIGLNNLDTSKVTDMSWMFSDCYSLEELDLSSFDTGKVTNMAHMFSDCHSLKELDLSSFNTGKVTDMSLMFFGCNSLEELDLSSFNTGKVTDMSSMFGVCNSLEELDLSSFDTGKVTNMGYMFSDCHSLEELDLSSFNTKNVTSMRGMFLDCHIDFPESQFNKEEVLGIIY